MTEGELREQIAKQLRFRQRPGAREDTERTLALIDRSPGLVNTYRYGVYPAWNDIGVMAEGQSFHGLSTGLLFEYKGLPLASLQEVYDFRNGRYTGDFAPDGKQALADILGKTIRFYYLERQYELDAESGEDFSPRPR